MATFTDVNNAFPTLRIKDLDDLICFTSNNEVQTTLELFNLANKHTG